MGTEMPARARPASFPRPTSRRSLRPRARRRRVGRSTCGGSRGSPSSSSLPGGGDSSPEEQGRQDARDFVKKADDSYADEQPAGAPQHKSLPHIEREVQARTSKL
jgi:hypothetical protein